MDNNKETDQKCCYSNRVFQESSNRKAAAEQKQVIFQ
jgi:hypothetical protein